MNGESSSRPEPWPVPTLEAVLATLSARGIAVPDGNRRVGTFGDSAALSRELLALITSGKKRGGACLLWTCEILGEDLPRVGDVEIVLDHVNEPALITRTVRVEAKPFNEVGADFAAVEGEGDGSLEYWRREHWKYFLRECARLGREASETMVVICETFEVVRVLRESGV